MTSALFSRRSYGVLLSRLIWPIACLLLVTLCFVVAGAVWTSEGANDAARERQRLQIVAALEQRLEEMKARVAEVGETAVRPGATRRDLGLTGFTRVLIAGADGRLAPLGATGAGPVEPEEAALLSGLVAAARANALEPRGANGRDLVAGRILFDGTAPVAAVAVARSRPSAGSDPGSDVGSIVGPGVGPGVGSGARSLPELLVGTRRLDELDLKQLADRQGTEGLRARREAPTEGQAGVPILDERGEARAYLVWQPDRPGDDVRARVVPVALLGGGLALAMFALVVASIRWIARDLAEAQEHTQRLLGRDPLSELPNRLLFGERLDQEISRLMRTGEGLAVHFLDLDRFKDVNDTFGHAAGDELIKQVAKRLTALLRGEDTLARFGGDEFAVIQTRTISELDASALARRILDALTQPFVISGTNVTVGVSIGIALAPVDGTERESLMRLADTALYQAKSEGRNRFCFFARAMDETIRMRKVVEDDLRQAIRGDELTLHYQPIYSADGRTIVAVEALARWPHPQHGMISPAKFIAVAEERGLVIPLGEWVLRRACREAVRWPGVRLAVNVSPIQFHHRDFVASVMRALAETGFEAARLEIELTEGVVVEDADAAEAAMMELRALGVNLALDDFGTGYSSLIYLRRFAFDTIKIDRSFLESMEATGESAILVHSIVHLGRALGLTVTAEGVETREQHRFLQALGCHQLQGFLFSKPVPPEAITVLLAKQGAQGQAEGQGQIAAPAQAPIQARSARGPGSAAA